MSTLSNRKNLNDNSISRRGFIRHAGSLVTLGAGGLSVNPHQVANAINAISKIRVRKTDANFEREQMHPYRFKGSAISEAWQAAAWLQSDSGVEKIGLGTQSVLWSDPDVFAVHSIAGGNALMFAITEKALQILQGNSFSNPVELLDDLVPELLKYGKKISGNDNLRKTFVLNALVCVDNAAWLLYAAENGLKSFDEMIPATYKAALPCRHNKVASITSFATGTDPALLKSFAEQGYFIMKLKIGAAGNQKEMLEKDMAFLSAVHAAIGHYITPYTRNGLINYYLDPNGRYEKKNTLLRLLDHAKKIGAFDQIAVIEEPFAENNESYAGDLGIIIAADESAHTIESAAQRIEQGYGAIVLKAIAKTLSMTLKMAKYAIEKKVSCFCADLTVNPILVDWNKSVAARLPPLPNMDIGLLETNGHQYYKKWQQLMSYHPKQAAIWTKTEKGVYQTDKSFYDESGGIFDSSPHYQGLFVK
jgi:L-alanine-DL-glutamate epimerase-like enolase superfamily enzyme